MGVKVGEIQGGKCSLRVCGIIGNGTRASKERARWFDCGIGNKGVSERYSFFEEDIHSRLQPGKRDTKTKNKVKQQLRYLVDAIRNLHLKFLQHPNVQVSYSTFLKHKPFWVIQPSIWCRETMPVQSSQQPTIQGGPAETLWGNINKQPQGTV